MGELGRVLAKNIEHFAYGGAQAARRGRALAADRTLQVLAPDLVAARAAAGTSKQDVANRMRSARSAVAS
jgi:hypothetical protein